MGDKTAIYRSDRTRFRTREHQEIERRPGRRASEADRCQSVSEGPHLLPRCSSDTRSGTLIGREVEGCGTHSPRDTREDMLRTDQELG